MIRPLILIVVAVAGTAAFVVRDHPGIEAPAEPEVKRFHSAPNPWSSDEVLAAQDNGEWYGEVRLERAGNGHYYSTATIGGADVHVIVDTGASVVALTAADARAAGFSWEPHEVAVVGRGASGDVHGVIRTIPQVTVGGITARNVEAIIIPQGLDTSLLGQSYLAHVRSVEIRGGQMVLSNM